MICKIKVIYENGVLKPLDPFSGLSEPQILNIVFDVHSAETNTSSDEKRVVRLGGVLKDHPLGDTQAELKKMRNQIWKQVETESSNG